MGGKVGAASTKMKDLDTSEDEDDSTSLAKRNRSLENYLGFAPCVSHVTHISVRRTMIFGLLIGCHRVRSSERKVKLIEQPC